jgi:hypothetical protein
MVGFADIGGIACLTEDGIPLQTIAWGRGRSGSTFTATQIRRAPLRDRDVTPPPAVFDWPR